MNNCKFVVINFFFLILFFSCSPSSGNHDSADSNKNDSILNVQVKAFVDSVLSQNMSFEWNTFQLTNSYSNNDTIVYLKGSLRSEHYFYKKFDVAGSFKIIHNSPVCKYLSVSHAKAGKILEMKEMYDSIFTFCTDSASFLDNLQKYYDHPNVEDQIILDRYNLVERAYANETKVHFGISEYDYISLGREYQRNFYEGLIGKGAFELAVPKFYNDKFIGFEIIGGRDKSFSFRNVITHARLMKKKQLGYNAHESFLYVYDCKLCNIELYSGYDKFDKVYKHSLSVYWKR